MTGRVDENNVPASLGNTTFTTELLNSRSFLSAQALPAAEPHYSIRSGRDRSCGCVTALQQPEFARFRIGNGKSPVCSNVDAAACVRADGLTSVEVSAVRERKGFEGIVGVPGKSECGSDPQYAIRCLVQRDDLAARQVFKPIDALKLLSRITEQTVFCPNPNEPRAVLQKAGWNKV